MVDGELVVARPDHVSVLGRFRTVPLRPVDRLAQLHGDLGRQRPGGYPPGDQPERRAEHQRHHLDPEQPVESEGPRHPLTPGQDDDGLVGTDGHCGDHGHLEPQRQSDDAGPLAEVDAVAVPPGPEDLVVTAGVVDQDPAATKDLFGGGRTGIDRAGPPHDRSDPREPQEEGVEQRVDRLVLAPLAPPHGQQDGNVRRHLATRMVPHDEERASLGQPVEAPHLGAEVGGEPLQNRTNGTEEVHVSGRSDPGRRPVGAGDHIPTMHPGCCGVVGDGSGLRCAEGSGRPGAPVHGGLPAPQPYFR